MTKKKDEHSHNALTKATVPTTTSEDNKQRSAEEKKSQRFRPVDQWNENHRKTPHDRFAGVTPAPLTRSTVAMIADRLASQPPSHRHSQKPTEVHTSPLLSPLLSPPSLPSPLPVVRWRDRGPRSRLSRLLLRPALPGACSNAQTWRRNVRWVWLLWAAEQHQHQSREMSRS